MANPIIAVATVLLAAVGAIAAFTSASKKAREARIAENDAAYESADAAQKEAEAIERSSTAFLNAYDRYKEGTLSKKELAEVSDQLVEILGAEAVEVAKLTGNYDDLVDKLKETKKQAIGKQINEIENKKSSAASNMGEKAIEKEKIILKFLDLEIMALVMMMNLVTENSHNICLIKDTHNIYMIIKLMKMEVILEIRV